MERPGRFENSRYVGDKRTQVVYDVDGLDVSAGDVIAELLSAGTYLCFAPDTLAEARNRGYRLYSGQRSAFRRSSGA
jgi:hypothetical protein